MHRRLSLLSRAVSLALVASVAPAAALAADAPAEAERANPTDLDTLIVTGTRVSDRTVAESTAPIDIITPQTLEATGTVELATALARALPSLNFPRPAITDATDAVRPAQLRGLAPDQVLVLVNGKRRHTTALINLNDSIGRGSSPVDLNAIPIAAIERVEVLRDGASAQYGSDAIAGVINIVLKGAGEGGSVAARYGQYSAGDGEQYQLSGDVGFKLGDNGAVHLAAQGGHSDNTNRARPYLGPVTPTSNPKGRVVHRYGDPEIDQGAFAYNAQYQAAEGVEFYSFGTASRRRAISNGYYRAPGNPNNILSVYPDGFLPQIDNVSKDRAAVLGLRGKTAGGWNLDLSYNYGQNQLDFDVRHSLNRTLGASSPRSFYIGSLETTQNVLNADFNKAFDVGWLKYPLTVAFGAEWRGEKFNQSAGEPASYIAGPEPGAPGAQVFPGFTPSDASRRDRHSYSFYADLESDVTDKLSLGAAARYESYSDFGETTSGKLSARYAFNDKVALRGTVSTGFRAPSLQQQFYQSTQTVIVLGDPNPFQVRTFAVDDPAAVALGAEPLKAEESTNLGLGLVLQPVEGLYITVDAYQVDIDDRIILSENLRGPAVASFLEARGYPGINGGRYFTNAVDTRTRGLDIVGSYKFQLAGGALDLTAGYNRNKTTLERIAPNPPELTAGGLNLQRIGRVERGRITQGAPQDKFFLGGSWNRDGWRFDATATRYGEFHTFNDDPSGVRDQTFAAKWTLDLAATYAVNGWEFTVGGDNVLNEYPDESIYANSESGQLPYTSYAPFGFNGAFAYAKVGYKW
ncbi:TonB-dependent receptor plug domain-containing protein [Lysobacter enzymogenes]|uniref:TonB-dependent receptor plug domain-containing protein n=1 Tax=Lysobacter enzymogenes TaxID=69 RepID=UPI001A970462|nr:TonB-dependent receptor [Lysobacter enzymogenes]QQP98469.1 TonB-dependent receptor [Lysobacter enzymogenes]